MPTDQDVTQIRQLLEDYIWANDAGDVEGVVQCFVADGAYDAFGHLVVGHDGIRQLFARRVAARPDQPIVNGQHWLGQTRVTGNAHEARAVSYFMRVVQSRADDTPSIQSAGWYDDRLLRQQEWRIAHRIVTHAMPASGVV